MKYSEFRKFLKGTDFELIEDDVLIQVNTDGLGCVKIAKNTHRQIILPFAVEEPEQFELIRKALELAETPLDEREEEKMKMFLIFDREAEELSILSNDEAIDYINELELPLSNDPDEGDFIIKYLDDEEIKELAEFYEIFVTELKKFRGKESFKIEPFYLTGGERNEI